MRQRLVDGSGRAADNCASATPGTRLFSIMRKATLYARTSALSAIAAAMALSSTHSFAQEAPTQAQPTTTQPQQPTPAVPTVSATPAPTIESTPTTDTAISPPDIAPAKTSTTVRSTRTATAAKPAAVATSHKATQTVTRTARATVPVTAPPAAAPKPAAAPASSPVVAPVVEMTAKRSQPAATGITRPANRGPDTALEIGGGAIVLLAVGAGAWALSRRRRDEYDVTYDEPYERGAMGETEPVAETETMPRHDPLFEEQPAIVGPEASAFAWGNRAPAERTNDDGSDRRPGETWVERAYRGPSPANPSVSLKNRLRRAAFFDKRERDVAAGKAAPVEADAGLPDAMTEEQEREFA